MTIGKKNIEEYLNYIKNIYSFCLGVYHKNKVGSYNRKRTF